MRNRFSAAALIFAAALLVAGAASAQLPYTVSSNITTGAQYDLYVVDIPADTLVTATLVCDETIPGNNDRPLDPVLSAYLPGSDPSDTINADYYNDDGFGTDDDPNGVSCNAFDSSRIIFQSNTAVTMTWRVDGFGSATGPYTLTILGQPGTLSIPTLDGVGVATFSFVLLLAAVLFLRARRRTTH
jgi:hypothetical protein